MAGDFDLLGDLPQHTLGRLEVTLQVGSYPTEEEGQGQREREDKGKDKSSSLLMGKEGRDPRGEERKVPELAGEHTSGGVAKALGEFVELPA